MVVTFHITGKHESFNHIRQVALIHMRLPPNRIIIDSVTFTRLIHVTDRQTNTSQELK